MADKKNKIKTALLVLVLLVSLDALSCTVGKRTSISNLSNSATPVPSTSPAETKAKSPTETASLNPGDAAGSYTAKGETVILKYAYAGRGERFGSESVIVLLTDKPIPPEALAEELKSQTMLGAEKIRGLEYVFSKDGYWIRFHPSQYQESRSSSLKDYSVENDIVKGSDEDKGDMTEGKYSRSVKFVAKIIK